ncbi:MAG: hypothetical protein ABI617_03010 [Sphingomicrobium sp.]
MKYLLLSAAVAGIIGYAWFGRGEANVYSMTPAEAYSKLRAAPIQADGKTAFGRLVYVVSGDGDSKLYWNGSGGTFASSHCEADITPEGAAKSRIMAHCNGGSLSDGAAAGMVSGMQRKALIEHIDATLEGRPFDVKLAQGSTASGWPSDARQADGSLGTAMGDALKMERDMNKMMREAEGEMATAQSQSGVQFQPGKPMVNVNPNSR